MYQSVFTTRRKQSHQESITTMQVPPRHATIFSQNLTTAKHKGTIFSQQRSTNTTNNMDSNNKNIYIVVPYIRGLGKTFKKTCNKADMQVHFKGHNTIQTLLIAPKDKATCARKVELSTTKNVHTQTAPEQYIVESCRIFGSSFREHLRAPSPIHLHSQTTGQQVDLECFAIIDREAQGGYQNNQGRHVHLSE